MANRGKKVTRRDFIRDAAVAVSSAAGLVRGRVVAQTAAKSPKPRSSRVVLVRDELAVNAKDMVNVDVLKKMVDETVIRLTGEKKAASAWKILVRPEDTVGLVNTDHLNKTHAELVEVVRAALIDAGIPQNKIVMAQGDPDRPRACTALIALPALKAHWLTGIGTVLKNYIMYSGSPDRYHDKNSAKLGEIWNLPFVKGKTRLVLVDALYPLCDKGPQPDPRYRWAYCGLVAGKDPVAVETVCLKIIMEKRNRMKGEHWPLSPPPACVETADKVYGLGTSKWEEISLEKIGWAKDALI